MPPKAKITREMIVDAAFEIARAEGANKINARTVSQRLGCSTQPVMYRFSTIEELKKEVYQKADAYHSAFLSRGAGDAPDPMLSIGLQYIRFAAEERCLFRFLFQSNGFERKSLTELIDDEALAPVLTVLRQATGLDTQQAKTVFITLFLVAHGYACLFANNDMRCDETELSAQLEFAFRGALSAAGEG